MDEFELIDRFFSGRGPARPEVLLGIGDDAAAISVPGGCELIVATDSIVAGTHFPPSIPANAIGYRSLAVNLSDLAAMGAEPLCATLALSLPEANADWLADFADGFFSLAERYSVALVGGDTVRGPLAATVTIHGFVPTGERVERSSARAGDEIFVTGYPGAAAVGLQTIQSLVSRANAAGSANESQHIEDSDSCVARFLYPEPRVEEGLALRPIASAMLDVSDGLAVDAERLLRASHCGAQLDISALPTPANSTVGADAKLAGGDDYELLFTVPPARLDDAVSLFAEWPVPVTRIGTVTAEPVVQWMRGGQVLDAPTPGFRHFD